ncbi:MAG: hypothetical protein A3H96_02980 [Acidobacteria bacterium RIFCSPLOWO2_02_FULL_67_36]|nr:MAG: hypothetical protein A3H96_02980 [Acidobacteria bacterium RIFCSPLOWO2_02_FULL_67_36]
MIHLGRFLGTDMARAGAVLKRLTPYRKRLIVSIVGILAAVMISWQPLLLGVAAFMAASSPLEKADFILLLYHDSDSIPAGAADLYQRRLAPRVLLYGVEPSRLEKLGLGPPAHEVWRKLLEARGVPPHAIDTIGSGVSTDRELADAIRGLAQGRPLRVIVVASSPASRLARNGLRKNLEGSGVELRMHPVRPRNIDARAWWRSRAGWIAYFDAYCLWVLRFLR